MATHFELSKNGLMFLGTFSLSVFEILFLLFCHFTAFFFRLRKGDCSLEKRFDFSETEHTSEEFNDDDDDEIMDHMNESEEKEKATDFTFKFNRKVGLSEFIDSESLETCFDGFIEEAEDDAIRFAESRGESVKTENDFDFSEDVLFQSEKDSSFTDSDSGSIRFEHMDFYSDGFLSDEDFEIDSSKDFVGDKNQDSGHFNGNEGLIELEQDHLSKMESMASEFLSENDFHDTNIKWDHQDLIEQLKGELRKVRPTSLPTILEESDESQEMEDLKPWKNNVDQNFQAEACMVELQQFYKAYRERMRSFDLLTCQKMYALGFLQKKPLKDPLQLLSTQKSSFGLTLKSIFSQNIWLFKQKIREVDPMANFIKEVCSDLEVVYVGQMCLSWEFLHWQYIKALEFLLIRGTHQYNEICEEFHHFIVLMVRFIEDEAFQGTRVQNYIKCRCDFRSLLQVPLIKEDSLKEEKKARESDEKGGNFITSIVLVEIMEECIRIFWRFVKADKKSFGVVGKGHRRVHPQVRNAEDIGLLREVTKSLHKKEKKLKNTLRSENSILRSLKSCKEEDIDHNLLYFFSQVDMKLVSRVLNMSIITRDQLLWCHNKLSRISFKHRKIHVQQSFLLFPCSY